MAKTETETRNYSPFCTCRDLACPMHPTRHGHGCSPCVAKNLKQGEIPSCFWRTFTDISGRTDFSKEAFAKALSDQAVIREANLMRNASCDSEQHK